MWKNKRVNLNTIDNSMKSLTRNESFFFDQFNLKLLNNLTYLYFQLNYHNFALILIVVFFLMNGKFTKTIQQTLHFPPMHVLWNSNNCCLLCVYDSEINRKL